MNNEKGFTLIELVVSVAMLSILIVPFFGIFTNAAKLDMRSKKDLTANHLAQHIASEVKGNPDIFSDETEYMTPDGPKNWTTESEMDLSYLIGNEYKGFYAEIEYGPLVNLSVELEDNINVNDDVEVDEEITALIMNDDKNHVDLFFDLEVAGDFYDKNGNGQIKVMIEKVKTSGQHAGEVEIKIQGNSFYYPIDSVMNNRGFILIKIVLLGESDYTGERDIEIKNKNTDEKYNVRYIIENFNDSVVTINDDDDNVDEYDSYEDGDTHAASELRNLTVKITGHDPVSKTDKVFKTLSTLVAQ
ncbi:MAG TPA: type II secretion system protein [Clostridia bacterium]|nr:type II secretion system protein [Clostridia bacterium]